MSAMRGVSGRHCVRCFLLALIVGLLLPSWVPVALGSALASHDWERLASGELDSFVTGVHVADGRMFITGWFDEAKDRPAPGFAAWDGRRWSVVGPPVHPYPEIRAVAWDGARQLLYVAGPFESIGGVAARGIAVWDGNRWKPVIADGAPPPMYQAPEIHALAVDPATGHVYAGGVFAFIDGVRAFSIARWDGRRWSALGAGIDDVRRVRSLLWSPEARKLFVVGEFSRVDGGVPAEGLAVWGDSGWSGLVSEEFRLDPGELAYHAGSQTLYIGGQHSRDSSPYTFYSVLALNGERWSLVGDGRSNQDGFGRSGSLAVDPRSGLLYASLGTGDGTDLIQTWDGQRWTTLMQAPVEETNVMSLAWDEVNGALIAVGGFKRIGGIRANNVAAWRPAGWTAFDVGTSGEVRDAVSDPATGSVYAGGSFTLIDGVEAARVARWDGARWLPLGGGIGRGKDDVVESLAWDPAQRRLYAFGRFDIAGGQAAVNAAYWDGAAWHAMGRGLRADNEIVISGSLWDAPRARLIVHGRFDDAGDVGVKNIAVWDGTRWSRMGSGLDGPVNALAVRQSDGAVFAGGSFLVAGEANGRSTAVWNGGAWQGIAGVSGPVGALDWDPATNSLLVAGHANESTWSGQPVTPVHRWTPATQEWTPIGDGLGGHPTVVEALDNGALLVGGIHAPWPSGDLPDGLNLWDGCSWRPVVRATGTRINRGRWDAGTRTLLAAGRLAGRGREPMRVGRLQLPGNTEHNLWLARNPVVDIDEDRPPAPVAPSLRLCDIEGSLPTRAEVKIIGGVPGETLHAPASAADIGGITGRFDASTATLTLQSAAGNTSLAHWQEALRRVGYSSAVEGQAAFARTVRFTAFDGATSSLALDVRLNVRPTADAPEVSGPASIVAVEDVLLPLLGFDFRTIESAPSVIARFGVDRGQLSVEIHPGVSLIRGFREVVLSGSADNVRAALAAGRVTFRTDTDDTTPAALTFAVTAGGTATLARTVTVQAVDDPTVLDAGFPRFSSYTEGGPPLSIVGTPRLIDPDSAMSVCAAEVSRGGDAATDRLGGAIPDARWNASTLRLDLIPPGGAPMSLAQCTAGLGSVTFVTTSKAVRSGARDVRLIVGATAATVSALAATVSVASINDPAVLTPSSMIVDGTEDEPLRLPALGIDEPDSALLRMALQAGQGRFELTGDMAGLVVGTHVGGLTLSGAADKVIAAASRGAITYTPAQDANGSIDLTIEVTGADAASLYGAPAVARWALRISPVADAPRFLITPSIAGLARPRETLTIRNDQAVDADGDAVTVRRQWLRNGVEIPGAIGASYVVADSDLDQRIAVRITASDGTLDAIATTPSVLVSQPTALFLRDDRVELGENVPAANVAMLANDVLPVSLDATARVAIVAFPRQGTASLQAGPSDGIADDVVRFVPPRNWSGVDRLRYQVCTGSPTPLCGEADISFVVRPTVEGRGVISMNVPSAAGHRDLQVTGARPVSGVMFVAAPLRQPYQTNHPTGLDETPESPWDRDGEGGTTVISTIAAEAAGRPHLVIASAVGFSGDMDLYMGVDVNGDGLAAASEVRCTSAMSTTTERCEFEVQGIEGRALRYWALLHNRSAASQTLAILRAEVPLSAGDGTLVATAPGRTSAGEAFPLRLQWNDATFASGERRWGALRIVDGERTQATLPVFLGRTASEPHVIALTSGREVAIRLPSRVSSEHVYIDVPPGTTRLEATTSSASNVDLYLARIDAPSASGATPTVPAAPSRGLASSSALTPSGNETLSITNPAAGRWYVTPVNTTSGTVNATVRATLTGVGPRLPPGGYFNPLRSGSGLFLYPAGNEWAGLWYTFLQDGTASWYYLQAPAPGPTGVWRGTIFRSAWNGTSNHLTPVGEATVTPQSTRAFTFSYTLDGETGSESYETFGGGCPGFGGAPLDVSGHWFDPTKAGTGYSVQLFPDYEFYAVFGYDAQGVPRYLVAERGAFGGATATLDLEQNSGACPLCARSANPVRRTIGTLSRSFGNGTLQRIQLSGAFTAGVPGTWAANDAVIPLGGLQGCAGN